MSAETRRRSERDEAAALLRAAAKELRTAAREITTAAGLIERTGRAGIMVRKASTMATQRGATGKGRTPVPKALINRVAREAGHLEALASAIQAHPVTELEKAQATAKKRESTPRRNKT